MPRPRKAHYFRDRWVSKFRGKRVTLVFGPDDRRTRLEAEQELARRQLEMESPAAGSGVESVLTVCTLYLTALKGSATANTYRNAFAALDRLTAKMGDTPARQLRPYHLDEWIAAEGWRPPMRYHAVKTVKAAYGFAVQRGVLDASPVARMPNPQPIADRHTLTDDQIRRLLDAVPDREFRDFLVCLRGTVARPSEVAKVTAAEVDLQAGAWVLGPRRHKAGRKTRRVRAIPLSPAVLTVTRRLVKEHPDGPIFRNTRGDPWTVSSVVKRFGRLRTKLDLPKWVTAYALRHTGTTELLATQPVAVVAEITGHADLRSLESYNHLSERMGLLRKAVASVGRKRRA